MQSFFHEAQIEVDGETLHLVCNFRAIDCIESLTGKTMPEVIAHLVNNPPHSLVGKVVWGLLREKHEGVTLDQAAAASFGPSGPAIGLVIGDLLQRAYPHIFGEAKDKNPPRRRGASKTSARNG